MKYLSPIIAVLVFFVLWEAMVAVFQIEKWILPTPSQIFVSFWEKKDLLIFHSSQTLMEAFLGLIAATVIGAGIAIYMEWSNFFRKVMYPFLILSQTIPFIALAPLLVIWLGYGILPKIVVITLACFFPIALNFYEGLRAVDQNKLRLLKSMNGSKLQIFSLLKVPSALPQFFSGLRLSGAYAIGVAVVSEWIGAENGLGIFLVRSAKSYLTDSVFAAIFVITLLSLVFVFVIDKITRLTVPWYFHKQI